MTLAVADDGCGGASTESGTGIAGLSDRVEAIGGVLSLRQSRRRRHPPVRRGAARRRVSARAGAEWIERQLTAVVVEDAPLMRRGIRQVLLEAGFALAADVDHADQVLAMVAAGETIDVAIVDIRMPPTFTDEGIRLLEQLRAAGSTAGVLLLSMYLDPSYAIRALAHGHRGVGYLLKDRIADLDAFVDCARRVAVRRVSDRPRGDRRTRPPPSRTRRPSSASHNASETCCG